MFIMRPFLCYYIYMRVKGLISVIINYILAAGICVSVFLGVNAYASLGDLGEPRSSYNLGSAKILEGKNIIVSVFVDTPSFKWSDDDMKKSLNNLDDTLVYITKEGEKYNKRFEFVYDWQDNTDLFYKARLSINPENTEKFETILDKRIDGWVKGTIKNAYSKVQNNQNDEKSNGFDILLKEYDADNIFMIVYLNCEGRSYAITYDGIDSVNESLIFYFDDGNNIAALAHEILHLYGAHDFYRGAEYTDDVVKYIKKKYPNDIMLTINEEGNITRSVGELTAYHLGWKGSLEDTKKYPQLCR